MFLITERRAYDAEVFTFMLLIVSTPIGNLADLSERAGTSLAEADIIACEDTRQTRKLLQLTSIQTNARLVAYHDHNGEKMRPTLLRELKAGKLVVLVSDAGTPLISDPGFKLVACCHDEGIMVSAAPGASAPITALSVSGLPSDRFTFNGFLPSKKTGARAAIIKSAPLDMTQIWFETPQRLAATLSLMHEILGPRLAVVARELTKLHEQIDRAPLDSLARKYQDITSLKGEIVLLVSGADAAAEQADDDTVRQMLAEELQEGSLRDAVRRVEQMTSRRHKDIYQLALEMKNSER